MKGKPDAHHDKRRFPHKPKTPNSFPFKDDPEFLNSKDTKKQGEPATIHTSRSWGQV
jgi:hypothetical protein